MSIFATPRELLHASRDFLSRPTRAGEWPRAAALLARQALEQAVAEFWMQRVPGMEACSHRAQMDCLGPYLDDDELAGRVRHAWTQLSGVVHHRAYVLAPTVEDLEGPMVAVQAFIDHTAERH